MKMQQQQQQHIPIKLQNVKNSCYLNVILQTLFTLTIFNNKIQLKKNVHNKPLTRIYQLICKNMQTSNYVMMNIYIKQLRQLCKYYDTKQKDASEVFLDILYKLHDELKEPNTFFRNHLISNLYKNDYSIVSACFSGQLLNVLQCVRCSNTCSKKQLFYTLVVPVQEDTLHKSLTKYFSKEKLVTPLYCSKCKNHTTHTKQIFMIGVPLYLIIIFNRFMWYSQKISKNNKLVSFPDTMNVAKYTNIPTNMMYSLTNIINHTGNMDHGHYYSFQKYRNQWFRCNDNNIQNILSIQPSQQQAYVLIFKKIEF
jgi:ubiquitin C-terminal hydrolase